MLKLKYPVVRVSDAADFDSYPDAEKQLFSFLVYFVKDEVETAASGFSEGVDQSRVDGTHLKNWLLRCKVSSERLHLEMAEWVKLLSNSTPDNAAYQAFNSGCSLSLDKDPWI